jgi:glycosyltransferase involved in cell wall biosynthesis
MKSPPTVSVVIPCRNEKNHIEACISSLLGQREVQGGFEIIVADGSSDDGTQEILEHLQKLTSLIRVVHNTKQVTASGMNAGVNAAKGRYIAIIGAHNRYADDYLCQSVAVLQETGADNVGGAMFCEGESKWQSAIAASHHSIFGVGGARWHNPAYEGPADTVFGGVYRREVFEQIGLFDETLVRNQDDEFNLRLLRSGGRTWQSPRIRSWYQPRERLSDLCRQYLQYGYWKVRVIRKHKVPASIRHLIPGCFVLCIILLPLISIRWRPALSVWYAILALYFGLNTLASSLAAARRGWNLLPYISAVFACLHFSYGWGFLCGIVDVVFWWRGERRLYSALSRRTAKDTADNNGSFGTTDMHSHRSHGT